MMVAACVSARSSKRATERNDALRDIVECAPHVQPKIGSDLVVARTPGMQSFARVADQLGQSLFDIQMDIFEIERPDKFVAFDFATDGRHPVFDRSEIRGRKHAHRREHPRVRQRTRNVDAARRRSKSIDAV